MKTKSLLAVILLVGFSAKAQFQLRPVMIKVNPISATTMDLRQGITSWRDKNYASATTTNPEGVGFGLSVYFPVIKSLWIGCSYSNSAYYKNGGTAYFSNQYINSNDTSGYIGTTNQYHLQKLTSYSIGLQWRPGRSNKFITPYFNIMYTMQLIKQSGYTKSVTTDMHIDKTDTTGGNYYSYTEPYYMNTNTDINQKEVYTSSGLTLGIGLDIRLSQHVLLNLVEINASNLSGSNNHAFSFTAKSGVTILLLKKK